MFLVHRKHRLEDQEEHRKEVLGLKTFQVCVESVEV